MSQNQDYRIVSEGLISVCMCCWPKLSIFEKYPELRQQGYEVSHGMCKTHLEEMRAELAAMVTTEA
jgi:hypothetical protein